MTPPLPLDEAREQLLSLAPPLPSEEVPVPQALERYLAAPLLARRTQPPADLSAMDGYALRGPDLAGPWRILGESAAGHPHAGEIGPGDAIRISTGALLPAGADTILLQEDARRDGDLLHLSGDRPRPGKHIRRAGFDFLSGDTLLEAGTRVTPAVVALALAGGHRTVQVHRLPRIAIIDSGDELATDPAHCEVHQIPASNGAMLAAMVARSSGSIARIGPVADDLAALIAALEQAGDADLIVTSGGASVGDHDLVRPALQGWGADIAFWRVAMKPGKPIMVARRGRQLVLGLPGNPVSSYVTAYLFLLPLLKALAGSPGVLHAPVTATVTRDLAPGGKRLEFLRGHWDGNRVTPLDEQDSSGLRALAHSNALILRPANAPACASGGAVSIYLLDNG